MSPASFANDASPSEMAFIKACAVTGSGSSLSMFLRTASGMARAIGITFGLWSAGTTLRQPVEAPEYEGRHIEQRGDVHRPASRDRFLRHAEHDARMLV